jgi:hypothetical protein
MKTYKLYESASVKVRFLHCAYNPQVSLTYAPPFSHLFLYVDPNSQNGHRGAALCRFILTVLLTTRLL